MPIPSPGFIVASGQTVYPSTFVMMNGNFMVQTATANARIIGIAFEGTEQPSIPSASSPYPAATAGNSLPVYTNGQTDVLLLVGSGGWTAGNHLVAAAAGDGSGAPMATSGVVQNIGAIALEAGSAGELRRVQVTIFSSKAAAT